MNVLAFDGQGQVLSYAPDCRIVAYDMRVSGLLGSTFSPTPVWGAQMPKFLSGRNMDIVGCAGAFVAAPTPTGWVVAVGRDMFWYDRSGAELGRTSIVFPTQAADARIEINQLEVDFSQGNVWGVGTLRQSAFRDCAADDTVPCPALIKVAPDGTLLVHTILGGEKNSIPDFWIALALDADGAAYKAVNSVDSPGTGVPVSVRRFRPNGSADWHAVLAESYRLQSRAIAVDAAGAVYVGTGNDAYGGSVATPALTFGRFVYKLTSSGDGAGFVRMTEFANSTASTQLESAGLSVDARGNVTYVGDFCCKPLDGQTPQGNDVYVQKFKFLPGLKVCAASVIASHNGPITQRRLKTRR